MSARFMRFAGLCSLATLTLMSTAQAAQRTFVSTSGVDNPFCSLTSPCRTFGAAVAAASSNGEVIVLDSGGYGPVTITQSISIIAPSGVYAGVTVSGAAPVGVSIVGGPNDRVLLRGLTVNGLDGGGSGIQVDGSGTVHIEDCAVSNLELGILTGSGQPRVFIDGTVARNNAGGLLLRSDGNPAVRASNSRFVGNIFDGISIRHGTFEGSGLTIQGNGGAGILTTIDGSPAPVTVTLTDSVVTGNALSGLIAENTAAGESLNIAVNRVTMSHNGGSGIVVSGTLGPATLVIADSNIVENSLAGVRSEGDTITIVTGNTVARNAAEDLLQVSGVLRTSANNALTGRGPADIGGTLTPNPLK